MIISTIIIPRATPKSTRAETTVENGSTRRGKNTFETRCEFWIMQLLDLASVLLKAVHPSSPA